MFEGVTKAVGVCTTGGRCGGAVRVVVWPQEPQKEPKKELKCGLRGDS